MTIKTHNIQDLEQYLRQGDPPADELMAFLFRENRRAPTNKILTELLYASDSQDLSNLHPRIRDFLNISARLPDWADHDRIVKGQVLFNQFSQVCLLSLVLASLPECYVNRRIASILGETQKLESRAYKRIIETAQFMLFTMAPDGLTVDPVPDVGIRMVQRVRLIHAAIRYMVKQKRGIRTESYYGMFWNEDLGEPISQLDLAYTLQTFATVTLRSLRLSGMKVTPEEESNFLHCWNVIGHLLGINRALLIDDTQSAENFFNLVKDHFGAHSDEGRLMTEAATNVVKRMFQEKVALVGWILGATVPRATQFRLLDAKTRELLGVPKANSIERFLWFPLLDAIRWLAIHLGNIFHVPLAGRIDKFTGFKMMKYFASPPEYLGKAEFKIPTSLDA